MDNLFDIAKPFAEEFDKVFLYIAAIALVANWPYSAYSIGGIASNCDIRVRSQSFNFGELLPSLLPNTPWIAMQIGLTHLFIELVVNSGREN